MKLGEIIVAEDYMIQQGNLKNSWSQNITKYASKFEGVENIYGKSEVENKFLAVHN